MSKSKTELRTLAKETLVSVLSGAYYRICDHQDDLGLTDDEVSVVCDLMRSYGTTMCKAIREEYYTT